MESAAGALRDAQGHLRVLVRAGRAVIAAHDGDADPVVAADLTVGWARFLQAVAEAEDLARPETVDVRADLVRRWPTTRQFAPASLDAFQFDGAPSASSLLKAVALLRDYGFRRCRTGVPIERGH